MPSPLEVTFSSGVIAGGTACATFGILNDANLEFNHEFTVDIQDFTPSGPVTTNPSSTVVSINDDEGIYYILYEGIYCILFPV